MNAPMLKTALSLKLQVILDKLAKSHFAKPSKKIVFPHVFFNSFVVIALIFI